MDANSIQDVAMVFGQTDLTDGNPTTSNIVQTCLNVSAKKFGHGHIFTLGLTLNDCLEFFVESDRDGWILRSHRASSSASCASSKHSAHVPSAFMRLASQ